MLWYRPISPDAEDITRTPFFSLSILLAERKREQRIAIAVLFSFLSIYLVFLALIDVLGRRPPAETPHHYQPPPANLTASLRCSIPTEVLLHLQMLCNTTHVLDSMNSDVVTVKNISLCTASMDNMKNEVSVFMFRVLYFYFRTL